MNANYIVDTLNRFLKTFKQKRPAMAAEELCFHWDNVLVHTPNVTNNYVDDDQTAPGPPAPAIFTRSGTSQLHSISQDKEGANRPYPREGVGRRLPDPSGKGL
jgi:hypothetical protein